MLAIGGNGSKERGPEANKEDGECKYCGCDHDYLELSDVTCLY